MSCSPMSMELVAQEVECSAKCSPQSRTSNDSTDHFSSGPLESCCGVSLAPINAQIAKELAKKLLVLRGRSECPPCSINAFGHTFGTKLSIMHACHEDASTGNQGPPDRRLPECQGNTASQERVFCILQEL